MEMGMFSWYGVDLPLSRRLKLIAEAGFSSTSYWLGKEEPLFSLGKADLIPDIAAKLGLAVEYVILPYEHCNGMWSDNPNTRAYLIHLFKQALLYCQRHDIPRLVTRLSASNAKPRPSPAGVYFLLKLSEMAETHGVSLAFENARADACLDFALKHIDSPRLGLCYDCSNAFLSEREPTALLKAFGPRCLVAHFSDNYGRIDDRDLPLTGRVGWAAIRSALNWRDFKGSFFLQVISDKRRPAEEFTRMAFQSATALRKFLLGEGQDAEGRFAREHNPGLGGDAQARGAEKKFFR
jgi:sugar phosphate isomerase/epimerase